MTTRRRFVETTLAGACALPVALMVPTRLRGAVITRDAGKVLPSWWRPRPRPASRPLRVLILGGTGFIGPHQVRYAMYRGHSVTLFNRGRSNPGLFPGVETLIGDRDGDLAALEGREWDAVIDNSGYVPRHVRDSAELLADSVGQYLFTSTGSVYDFDQDQLTEDARLLPLEDPTSEDVNRYYGPLKVLCEEAVRETFGSHGTVVRLHVVAGPGDPTHRFTYWPVRVHRGGDVILPGSKDTPVQFIDVRDLVEFEIHLLERGTGGTFNAAGPTLDEMGMAEFAYGVRSITASPVRFHWVDGEFVRTQQLRVPLWYGDGGSNRGINRVRSHRAVAAGLEFRPLAVTALDTLAWFETQPGDFRAGIPIDAEREAAALAAWRARGG